eukprot:g14037.t1
MVSIYIPWLGIGVTIPWLCKHAWQHEFGPFPPVTDDYTYHCMKCNSYKVLPGPPQWEKGPPPGYTWDIMDLPE